VREQARVRSGGRPRLAIAGASGKLGRRAAEFVVEAQGPDGLVLVSRTPGALADLVSRGCEVRYGDYDEPSSLGDAFAAVDRLLLISASDVERRAEQHRAAIRCAAAAGVRHVVYTSGLRPEPPNPAAIAESHHATERALAASGLAWTVLRNSLYAEYQVPEAAEAVASGVLAHNRGEGRIAYVSRDDCAAVAAAVLDGSGHAGCVYDVTGPQLFSPRELAALYAELGRRRVAEEPLDDDDLVERLQGEARDDEHARYGAQLVVSLGRSIREGYMASCTDVVARVTTRPARSLRDVLESDPWWKAPAALDAPWSRSG
jgi:NAD(P)H dehydrogenase (quinone)